jgi:hypothetical protein
MHLSIHECFAMLIADKDLAEIAFDPRSMTWVELANRAQWWTVADEEPSSYRTQKLIDILLDWIASESSIGASGIPGKRKSHRDEWYSLLKNRLKEGGYRIVWFGYGPQRNLLRGLDAVGFDEQKFVSVLRNYLPKATISVSQAGHTYRFFREAIERVSRSEEHVLLIIAPVADEG